MSLLGQGRLPLRTTYARSLNDLYKPIIPEATDVVAVAVKDYVLGRQTEMDLRYWDGTQWVYPTYFQKLVNRVDDRWPNTVKPDTLSDAVNEMATNRPWVEPPVGGNLTAGQALIATGNGLEVEQKLVEFEDATRVRYVGEEPGDYAYTDLQACLDSLPSGVDDLSSNATPYIINIRKSSSSNFVWFPSGIVAPTVRAITFKGVTDVVTSRIGCYFGKIGANGTAIGNATWGLKLSPSTVTLSYIRFVDIAITGSCTVAADWTSSEFNTVIIDKTDSSYTTSITLDNSAINISTYASSTAKTARAIYITNSNALSTKPYVSISFTKESGLQVSTYNSLMTFKLISTDGNIRGIISMSDTTEKTVSVGVGRSSPAGMSLIDLLWYSGATNLSATFKNVKFSVNYTREDTIWFSPSLIIFNITRDPTSFSGNYVHFVVDSCSAYLEASDTTTQYNFDNITFFKLNPRFSTHRLVKNYLKIGGAGTFSGFPTWFDASDNTVISDNNIFGGARVLTTGILQQQGSNSDGQLTSNNIIRDEKQLFNATARIAGKQCLTQSPLPPAAPQPGDLWIETTEQY